MHTLHLRSRTGSDLVRSTCARTGRGGGGGDAGATIVVSADAERAAQVGSVSLAYGAHCCSLMRRPLTVTKWYATMRSIAATPSPFERSVRLPSEIIASVGKERGGARWSRFGTRGCVLARNCLADSRERGLVREEIMTKSRATCDTSDVMHGHYLVPRYGQWLASNTVFNGAISINPNAGSMQANLSHANLDMTSDAHHLEPIVHLE